MPQANTLFMGSVPPVEGWQATPPAWTSLHHRHQSTAPDHAVRRYVDRQIVKGSTLTTPPGATTLLRSDGGVFMAVAPRDAFQDAVLGMGLLHEEEGETRTNTDWPIRPSFPVFLLNSLEYLGGSVSTAGSKSVQPGEPAVLSLASRFDKVKIIAPDKERRGHRSHGFTATDLQSNRPVWLLSSRAIGPRQDGCSCSP